MGEISRMASCLTLDLDATKAKGEARSEAATTTKSEWRSATAPNAALQKERGGSHGKSRTSTSSEVVCQDLPGVNYTVFDSQCLKIARRESEKWDALRAVISAETTGCRSHHLQCIASPCIARCIIQPARQRDDP